MSPQHICKMSQGKGNTLIENHNIRNNCKNYKRSDTDFYISLYQYSKRRSNQQTSLLSLEEYLNWIFTTKSHKAGWWHPGILTWASILILSNDMLKSVWMCTANICGVLFKTNIWTIEVWHVFPFVRTNKLLYYTMLVYKVGISHY